MNLSKSRWMIAALCATGGIAAASAAPPGQQQRIVNVSVRGPVQMTNGIYHRAVCSQQGLKRGFAACHAHVRTDSRGNTFVGKPLAASPAVQPAGLGAFDIRNAYKIKGKGSASTKIAIVDAYGYPNAEADLAVYRDQMGLPACTTANGCFKKIDQNGGTSYPAFDQGWALETALDLDMVSATCPNCKIILVESTTNSFTDMGTAVNQAAAQGAHAISNSYGASEFVGETSYNSYYVHPGIAITVSSGDFGYGVQFPAASPDVIAVGGTNLLRANNSRGWKEVAWTGAGSGCSTQFLKPTWQADALCATRTVADTSAVSDPSTGVAVYAPTSISTAGWTWVGGTSAAAPIIAGIYGVNGAVPTNAYGQRLYGHTANLFDIKTGSNGSCGGTYLCTAGTGYDGPTGLGTPNGTFAF
jgi:hypothetical protein